MSDEIKLENRVEMFYNDEEEEVDIKDATWKYVIIYKDMSTEIEEQYGVAIIDGVDQEWVEEAEEFNDKHDNATGQFASKDNGGKINDFKNGLRDKVKTNKKIRELQEEVDIEITDKVWETIEDLGIKDKIKDVQMQGSYAKGTDLPTSGSDLDLFVIFNSDVSDEEKEKLGVEIGLKALDGKNPYIQTATTKYAEAFFEHKGEKMEVQIVPIRHLTLEQIHSRETPIGMERTPHQTAFMKQALKGKEPEVRMLKQFMKDTGLYDSSMKSQGFSGYSAEVLIHNFDTFENTLKFFADFKKGSTVGNGKRNEQNAFSLIDPIDPNRDLISAFSPVKIGRTIKTAQHFLEHGEPPKKSEPVEMESVSVSFDTTQFNEDTLVGQSRKSQNALKDQLKILGFDIEVKEEKITDDFSVDVPRTKMNKEEGEAKTTLTFGIDSLTIPAEVKDKGMPVKAPNPKMEKQWEIKKQEYRDKNVGSDFVEEDGKLKAVKKRQFTNIADALQHLTTTNVNKSGMSKGTVKDMQGGVKISTGKSKFENLI